MTQFSYYYSRTLDDEFELITVTPLRNSAMVSESLSLLIAH